MKISFSKRPVSTLPVVERDWKEERGEFFRKLGKKRGSSCQILLKKSENEEWKDVMESTVCALLDGAYRLKKDALKTLDKEQIYEMREELAEYGDVEYVLISDEVSEEDGQTWIKRGMSLATKKGYARTLGNLPNNYLHTEDLVTYAQKVAENLSVSCKVFGDEKLHEMHAGGILAVNQGSRREAAMVVLTYEGAPDEEKIGLVGKGLMFDAGGYHLKSIDGMNGMKYDMCGAAGILEVFEFLVEQKVRKNVMAVLVLAENVISADAVKMGDVITMLSGHTVEVYNTDAEGRLVLADGLTYVQTWGADMVIDLATLTYGAQAALGDGVIGLFVNHEEVFGEWMQRATVTGERFWRLPMDRYYHNMLNWSICADFANYAPGKGAAASTAACFLENFIKEGTKWVHLDMVGPSVNRSENEQLAQGATGAGIATILKFIEEK